MHEKKPNFMFSLYPIVTKDKQIGGNKSKLLIDNK